MEVIPATAYQGHIEDATTRIGARDMGDVPFVALALASKCDGVWTHNQKHFESAGVRVWSTADVAAWTRSAGSA